MLMNQQLERAASDQEAEKAARKIAILVVGMHRSGTSAIARTLNLLGCDLPKTLVPPGVGNLLGHWESKPIVALNDEILASAGSAWSDWEGFNPSWNSSPIKQEFCARALDILANEFGFSRLFILKDPRICRLLPFWIDVLKVFGAKPLIICPVRNPSDVAASLEERDGMDPSVGQLLWLRHVLDAEFYSRDLSRNYVRYDELLLRWHAVARQLSKNWGITWPRQSTAVELEIDAFLAKTHRHHAADDGLLLANPRLSRWVRSSFEIFNRWTRGEVRETDTSELDNIRTAFEEAAPAFTRPLLIGQRAAQKNAVLENNLAAARAQLLELDAAIAGHDAILARCDAQRVELATALSAGNEELKARIAQIGQLKTTVASRQFDLEESVKRIRELEGVSAAVTAELTSAKARSAALEASVAQREANLAANILRLRELQHTNADITTGLTKAKNQIGALEASLAAREADFTANIALIRSLQEVNARSTAEAAAAKDRFMALEAVTATRDAEHAASVTVLEQTLSEKNNEIASLQQTMAAHVAHVTELQATILALYASISWRIMAPLREAKRIASLLRYSSIGFPLTLGCRALRTKSRAPLHDWRAARAIARSDLFDSAWYRRKYPDVARSGINPISHYVAFGAREGRDPGPEFSTRGYLDRNPDVAAAKVNPLGHYLLYGVAEGRLWDRALGSHGDRQQRCAVPPDYAEWIAFAEPTQEEIDRQSKMHAAAFRPLISVIIPVYKIPTRILQATINSLLKQTNPNWEACIAYGDAQNETNWNLLLRAAKQDQRFRLTRLVQNTGISGNSNAALTLASGEFLALLDHDDELAPWALKEMAQRIIADPEIDFLYSDKDQIDELGVFRQTPLFKPEWSPEMLYSVNYLTHLCVMRRSLVDAVGGWRTEMDGAQDWDLFYRVTEKARKIVRVPGILYHWRMIATSVASGISAKPYAPQAQLKTQEDRVRRLGLPATVVPHVESGFRLLWKLDPVPCVDIVLISDSTAPPLDAFLNGLTQKTKPLVASVSIVAPDANALSMPNEDALKLSAFEYCSEADKENAIKLAIAAGDAPVLLLFDPALHSRDDDWMFELVGWTHLHPDIAFVGPLILSDDNAVIEAGRVVNDELRTAPLFRGASFYTWGPFGGPSWFRNVSAVSPRAVAWKRVEWARISINGGGKDWTSNFVSRCLAAGANGRRGLITPHARVYAANVDGSEDLSIDSSFGSDPFFSPVFKTPAPLQFNLRDDFDLSQISLVDDPPVQGKGYAKAYMSDAFQLAQHIDCDFVALARAQQNVKRLNPVIGNRTCNWYVPVFGNAFYGGIMTILRLAAHLQDIYGVKQRFIVCGQVDPEIIKKEVAAAFATLERADIYSLDAIGIDNVPAADYSVATLWTTAYVLLKVNNTGLKFYLIQDYEPLFYPAGSTSAQAELSYRFGFFGITNTIPIKYIYEREYGGTAFAFTPCVDRHVYYPGPERPSDGVKRLFYYARPNTPRNGFELAAIALRRVKERFGDRVEIVCAGANWEPFEFGLEGILKNLGCLAYSETGDLYRTCHVGLVMMMTRHPSYVPFELMACGCLVVSNQNPINSWLLRDGENCLLTPPTASCISETLRRALDDYNDLGFIRRNAAEQIRFHHSDWTSQMDKVAHFMHAPNSSI